MHTAVIVDFDYKFVLLVFFTNKMLKLDKEINAFLSILLPI